MAALFYREDRDTDFINACEKIRHADSRLSVAEVVRRAILHPARSFYIHPREYANIIRRGWKKLPKGKASREQHTKILTTYEQLRKEHPELKEEELNKRLSEQQAPRFYISQSRGMSLYYQYLRK